MQTTIQGLGQKPQLCGQQGSCRCRSVQPRCTCTPTMPVPSTLMRATLSMVAKPFTDTGPVCSLSVHSSLIWVPARRVLGTQLTLAAAAGWVLALPVPGAAAALKPRLMHKAACCCQWPTVESVYQAIGALLKERCWLQLLIHSVPQHTTRVLEQGAWQLYPLRDWITPNRMKTEAVGRT